MNPSDRLQKILELLDQPTQSAGDVSYEFTDPTLCWRCEVRPPCSLAAGLCSTCHEYLQSDSVQRQLDVELLSQRAAEILGRPLSDWQARWLWGMVSPLQARSFVEVTEA